MVKFLADWLGEQIGPRPVLVEFANGRPERLLLHSIDETGLVLQSENDMGLVAYPWREINRVRLLVE